MSVTKSYIKLLAHILDQEASFPGPTTEEEIANPDNWKNFNNHQLDTDLTIFKKLIVQLEDDGAIKTFTMNRAQEQRDGEDIQKVSGEPIMDEDVWYIDYVVLNAQIIEQRLKELTTKAENNPAVVDNVEQFGAKVLHSVESFDIYDNGQITYRGNTIHIRKQLAYMLELFLRRSGEALNATDLKEVAEKEGRPLSDQTIAQYVSLLKNNLKKQTGKEWINPKTAHGWIFDLQDDS